MTPYSPDIGREPLPRDPHQCESQLIASLPSDADVGKHEKESLPAGGVLENIQGRDEVPVEQRRSFFAPLSRIVETGLTVLTVQR